MQYFTNGLDTRTQGVDITAGYKVPAGPSGTLELTAGFNYTRNKIIHVDPLPQVLMDAGSTEPGLLDSVTAIGIQDERPDWRGTLQANYTIGPLHLARPRSRTTAASPRPSPASAISAARTTAGRAWSTPRSDTGST